MFKQNVTFGRMIVAVSCSLSILENNVHIHLCLCPSVFKIVAWVMT